VRSIRKLYLQNAAGQRFGLNGQGGVYASNLSGFGFSLNTGFADLGSGFFRPVSDRQEPQQHLSFTVTFTANAYPAYQRFVDWLAASGGLVLVYQPFNGAEYFRSVSLNSVQKGELSPVGWLECPCTFVSHTPWYRPAPTVLALETGVSGNGKRYPYRYPYRYGSDSAAALTGVIAPAGHIPGALELSYTGAIVNPKIRLRGNISGKTYGVCAVSTSLAPTDTLRFSSRYERSFVSKITAAGAEADLLDHLDLSTGPFFHLPVDEPCTLTVESDDLITGTATAKVFYYYRSV
jgi:hypothetical protein